MEGGERRAQGLFHLKEKQNCRHAMDIAVTKEVWLSTNKGARLGAESSANFAHTAFFFFEAAIDLKCLHIENNRYVQEYVQFKQPIS